MSQTYKKLILDYCAQRSIFVPVGFGRNTPSRYAVVRTDQEPPKLVATTWFKQEDVAYYLGLPSNCRLEAQWVSVGFVFEVNRREIAD